MTDQQPTTEEQPPEGVERVGPPPNQNEPGELPVTDDEAAK